MACPSAAETETGQRPAAAATGKKQGVETRRACHDPLFYHLLLAAGGDLRPRGMWNRPTGQRDRLFHAGPASVAFGRAPGGRSEPAPSRAGHNQFQRGYRVLLLPSLVLRGGG